MDTARTERGLLPRLLSRALLVLGGAVLATAAGWLISTASASAATLPGLPTNPVADTVRATVHQTTAALSATADSVARSKSAPLPHTPDGVRKVTGALSGAVGRLGAHVPVKPVSVPALPTAPAGHHVAPAPHSATASRAVPTPHLAVRSKPAAPAHPAPVRRAPAAPSVHVAQPTAPARPVLPGLPAPNPWSPVTVPAPSSGGAGATGAGGGLGFADHTGALPVPALHVERIAPLTAPAGLDTPGRQPGTTPD